MPNFLFDARKPLLANEAKDTRIDIRSQSAPLLDEEKTLANPPKSKKVPLITQLKKELKLAKEQLRTLKAGRPSCPSSATMSDACFTGCVYITITLLFSGFVGVLAHGAKGKDQESKDTAKVMENTWIVINIVLLLITAKITHSARRNRDIDAIEAQKLTPDHLEAKILLLTEKIEAAKNLRSTRALRGYSITQEPLLRVNEYLYGEEVFATLSNQEKTQISEDNDEDEHNQRSRCAIM